MERSSYSQRQKRSHTPRRSRRDDRHHSSCEYDDYSHQETSPHTHKRSHTPRRRRRDEKHHQNTQGCELDCYQHCGRFTGYHHDDNVAWNGHGTYQDISLMRDQKFSDNKGKISRCTGYMYCACHSSTECPWRFHGQYHLARTHKGSVVNVSDPDGVSSSENKDMDLWQNATYHHLNIPGHESSWQTRYHNQYPTFGGQGTQKGPLVSDHRSLIKSPWPKNPAAVGQYPPYQGQGTQDDFGLEDEAQDQWYRVEERPLNKPPVRVLECTNEPEGLVRVSMDNMD